MLIPPSPAPTNRGIGKSNFKSQNTKSKKYNRNIPKKICAVYFRKLRPKIDVYQQKP